MSDGIKRAFDELEASVLDSWGGGEEGRKQLYEHNQAFEEERRRRGF